ncbi:MAG: hypothetical protein IPJ85_04470 [Flavobacteriales bacterium]|nr:hypothetical protein [Flavobacteriales bacterium]
MPRIFNAIRQRLLKESRLTRYLIYAVGEILLVVVGILIALNINNASAERKTRGKELALLQEMQKNLRADLRDVRYNVAGNKGRIRANEAVLKALQDRAPLDDSLKYHFGNILGNYQISENTAAWENLKSVGIDLISDDILRNAISALYSMKYVYLENVEKGLDDGYQWNHIYPQVLEHLNVEAMWVSATPVDHERLMDDRKFEEILKMNLFIRKYMQERYEAMEHDIGSLLVQLEDHIRELQGHD